MTRIKVIVLIVGLLVCGSLGVVAAVAWSPEGSVAEGAVERVRHGVTETGRVEVVTTEGQVHRVIRWRTKRSGIETQTVEDHCACAPGAACTSQHRPRGL